jgi:uncharacterized membrane protein (DUF2068 family)
MKIFIAILGFLNGGYMLLDGIFVVFKGKFMGPEKPGPWANLFYKFGIDVFKLGPLFIVFGCLWLIWVYGLWTNQSWSNVYGLVMSLLTLWYLPIGSLFSIIIMATLLLAKQKVGL